jgi:hypothetical protein
MKMYVLLVTLFNSVYPNLRYSLKSHGLRIDFFFNGPTRINFISSIWKRQTSKRHGFLCLKRCTVSRIGVTAVTLQIMCLWVTEKNHEDTLAGHLIEV